MSASRYLEWANKNYSNGWADLLERVQTLMPRFQSDLRTLRNFDDGTLYKAVVAKGSSALAEVAASLLEVAPAATALEVENQYIPGRIDIGEISFFNWVNLLACCGSPDYTHHLADRLSRIDTHPIHGPKWHYARGFAALALGVRAVYRPLAAVGIDGPIAFTSEELVGFNNQALLRHLASAVESHATFEDVRPAWTELVHRMDGEQTAKTLDGGSLFWVGRIVWHQIGGNALGSVGDFVHRSFVEAAAAEANGA
ncbi:MAG: hypothetical protein HS111_10180 [Kofleriaceae bacterium]|nr:hypothetical protein [Kofleriaceae bacterium]